MRKPSVDWYAQDLQDSAPPTPESIARTYGYGKARVKARVYRSYVPVGDMPSPRLAEEEAGDEEGGGYDWTELQSRGSPPPPKVWIGTKPRGDVPAGEPLLSDGNHRVHFWLESRANYTHIPVWVIDERPTGFFGEPVDQDDEDYDGLGSAAGAKAAASDVAFRTEGDQTSFSIYARALDAPAGVGPRTAKVIGFISVVDDGPAELEFYVDGRWRGVRGRDWGVSTIELERPWQRKKIGTRLYELAAEEVRRRGGKFFSSDDVRSEQSEGFWAKQERKGREGAGKTNRVQYLGDRYVMLLEAMPAEIDLSGPPEERRHMRGPSLRASGVLSKTVMIYRAVGPENTGFRPMDYVTRSLKFAKGHAQHNADLNGEVALVLRMDARPDDVYAARNAGEFFYDGPAVPAVVVYRARPSAEDLGCTSCRKQVDPRNSFAVRSPAFGNVGFGRTRG